VKELEFNPRHDIQPNNFAICHQNQIKKTKTELESGTPKKLIKRPFAQRRKSHLGTVLAFGKCCFCGSIKGLFAFRNEFLFCHPIHFLARPTILPKYLCPLLR
jgi:hypothetical protein